jgi:hypothetical protein
MVIDGYDLPFTEEVTNHSLRPLHGKYPFRQI